MLATVAITFNRFSSAYFGINYDKVRFKKSFLQKKCLPVL